MSRSEQSGVEWSEGFVDAGCYGDIEPFLRENEKNVPSNAPTSTGDL